MTESTHVHLFALRWHPISPEAWSLRETQTRFWRLYWNLQDGAYLRWNDTVIPLRKNRFYFIPAGLALEADSQCDVLQLYAHFDVLGLSTPLQRELFSQPFLLPEELCEEGQKLAASLPEEGEAPLSLRWRAQSAIYRGLSLWLEALSPEQQRRARLLRADLEPLLPAVNFIDENVAQPLRVPEMARLCHMSESLFLRRFRECTGQTPVAYVLERRVQLAAQLLHFSDDDIAAIAATAGFGNRQYFSRQFQRHTGLSPARYRRVREGEN